MRVTLGNGFIEDGDSWGRRCKPKRKPVAMSLDTSPSSCTRSNLGILVGMADPANVEELKAALLRHPESIVGQAPDGRFVLILERLSSDSRVLTKFGLALRWSGRAERVCAGVWLVPASPWGRGCVATAARAAGFNVEAHEHEAGAEPISPADLLGFDNGE